MAKGKKTEGSGNKKGSVHQPSSLTEKFEPGRKVTWDYVPRGGYAYVIPVKAEVVRPSRCRVLIKAFKVDGSFNLKWVQVHSLRFAVAA